MPGSTGAVTFFRVTDRANVTQDQKTGAITYFSPRDVSGVFASSGITTSVNQTNLKSWLPPPRVPIGYVEVNGERLPVQIEEQSWWKFFNYVANTKLGGINGATVPDIALAVTNTQEQSATIAQNQTVIAAQANANADALAVTIEVAQTSALPGARMIPQPVRQVLVQ